MAFLFNVAVFALWLQDQSNNWQLFKFVMGRFFRTLGNRLVVSSYVTPEVGSARFHREQLNKESFVVI